MIGTWITLSDPAVSDIFNWMALDFVVVDMQHSMMSDNDMQNHIRNLFDRDHYDLGWVRVRSNTAPEIGRALDAGAVGVIVPQVMTPDDAKRAVMYSRGPVRSTGLWRSRMYGMLRDDLQGKVIVQIEHIDAVGNLDRIMAVEGVDGFLIGPYDLSASITRGGHFTSDEYLDAMNRVDAWVANNSENKYCGIHIPKPEDLIEMLHAKEKGYNFLAVGMDTTFLSQAVKFYTDEVRKHERSDSNGS